MKAEPILPIHRKRKLCRAPETPGGPLALKDVFILVVYCNVALSPFLRKNLSNHVTLMS